jgi:MFS family permease
MLISDLSRTNKNFSFQYLRVISFAVMILSAVIFLYFFIRDNFHIKYLVAVSCFFLFFCGILMWLFSYLALSEKSAELTFEKTSRQVKRLGWYSIGSFYGSGLCFYAGLIFFAQKGDTWRYSIILFTGAILGLVMFMHGFIQRKITKQHYELKKQQQEIIDMLSSLKLREKKDISGGTLLA